MSTLPGTGGKPARRVAIRGALGAAALLAASVVLLMIPAVGRAADDPKAAAVQLSDQAFALLGSIGGGSEASKALVGPIAGFAGDAQTLSGALGNGDRSAAAQAMAELETDRSAVDAAVKAHPGIVDRAKWESLKQQLDSLAKAIPPSIAPSASSVSEPTTGTTGVEPGRAQLKVKIESLGVDADQITHVKGFLAGRDLKSAGVYTGGREIRALDIGPPPQRGSLRIQFDIQLADLEPGTVIRVYDKFGHSAEAQVTSGAATAPIEPAERAERVAPADSGGVVVNRGDETAVPADSPESGGADTAEIPSSSPPSPSKRHINSHIGALSDVRIQIDNVVIVDSMLHEYQVIGRISGSRVERAAIYVDGSLAQELELASPDSFGVRAFNQTFVLNGASAAIRVYGTGDQYVESSIRAPGVTVPGPVVIPGYGVNPYAYGANPYGLPPSAYGVNPYAVNPYGRPINPYGPAIPGYNGYNSSPNINAAPGYNPYGYPYLGYPHK